jgi:hypothetical protein
MANDTKTTSILFLGAVLATLLFFLSGEALDQWCAVGLSVESMRVVDVAVTSLEGHPSPALRKQLDWKRCSMAPDR